MTSWETVDPGVPLLLLPVRIETQTEPRTDPAVPVRLRVRIYPDDAGEVRSAQAAGLLPDRFEVIARVAGQDLPPVAGAAVDLPRLLSHLPADAGTDPLTALAESLRATAEGTGWLGSYEEALAAGMAVTVELPPGTARLDALLVLGVRAGRDPQEESAAVAQLLAGHEDGGFVLPGAATNSTEAARADWTSRGSGSAAAPAQAPGPGSAARVLSHALGLPADGLDGWPQAAHPSEQAAGAMATALWPVTWGRFLAEDLREALVPPNVADEVRAHHNAYVRGRGPLPLIRLGRQPYGVLPVTGTAHYRGSTATHEHLRDVLLRLRPLWQRGAAEVASVPDDGIASLPEVLGLQPVSWGLRTRRLLSTGGPLAAAVSGQSYEQAELRATVGAIISALLGARGTVFGPPQVMGVDRALGVPMVADDDCEALQRMLEGAGPGDASVLQILLGLALSRTEAALAALARADGEPASRARWLADVLHHESVAEFLDPGLAQFGGELVRRLADGDDPDQRDLDAAVLGIDVELDRQPWLRGLRTAGLAVPGLVRFDDMPGPDRWEQRQFALRRITELRAVLRAAAEHAQVRAAVRTLAEVQDAALRQAVLAETLDCTSHRLDAWTTSLATSRLHELRAARPHGLVVGAFGWVEDLVLVDRRSLDAHSARYPAGPVGAIHAPSLRHAATAAVLRGAKLAHAGQGQAGRALDLDASSTRMRQAREVLAGMRAGLELGALLGYRFERWLHEANPALNRFLVPLRTMAPSVAAKEVDRVAAGEVDAGVEPVAAAVVVDGVRLHELGVAAILARLADPPAQQRYGSGPPPDEGEKELLTQLHGRLGQLLDATADLLLAEGVHQLVGGSTARAAAAMEAAAGDGPPPDPEVIAAPGQTVGQRHRLAILLPVPALAGAAGGWAATPRARANPALELWCRKALGPASAIVVAQAGGRWFRLAQLGVGALDLLAAQDDGWPVFWARVRRRVPGLPEHATLERRGDLPARTVGLADVLPLVQALRTLLARSRVLGPADLVADVRAPGTRDDPARLPATQGQFDQLQDLAGSLQAVAQATSSTVAQSLALADELAAFGLGSTVDPAAMVDQDDAGPLDRHLAALREQALERLVAVEGVLGRTDAAAAAAVLVGSRMPVPVPLDPPVDPAAEPLPQVWASGPADRPAVRRWLARHSRVRPGVQRYTDAAVLRSALARGAGQVSLRAVTLARPSWYGEHLPPQEPWSDAVDSLVLEASAGVDPSAALAGLVVDSWHETVPLRRSQDGQPARDLTSTGLALHANGPDARPPQALLLGVTPDREPWSLAKAVALLDETRALARIRLATLDRVPLAGAVLPAGRVAHWSLQGERVVDPRLLASAARAVPVFVRKDGA
jgi:hypothetical protein